MPDIVNPGSDTAIELVIDVLNASWDQANLKASAYSTKVADAQNAFLDLAQTPTVTAGSVTVPVIEEPLVNIPTDATVTDVFDTFTTEYIELATWLTTQFTTFINTYFPDEQNAYVAMENWLQDAIANPDAGLPPAVAQQIWTNDRDRITSDALRAEADVLDVFAARRFPLPPGASASATIKIQAKAQDEIAESSRKVAITSVDLQKFNVEKLLQLRETAMKDAVEYVKALASGPDMISRMVNIGYDAQQKLISSVASYYSARTQAKEVMSKVAQYNNSIALEAGKANQSAELAIIEDKLKSLMQEAQGIAQMATALYNNLHAQAGVSGQRGTHVQYQYSNDTQTAPPSTTDVF